MGTVHIPIEGVELRYGTIGPPESSEDARTRRAKELALFFTSILILVVLVAFSVYLLMAPCAPDADRWWATSTLTAVFGGILGWLIKR